MKHSFKSLIMAALLFAGAATASAQQPAAKTQYRIYGVAFYLSLIHI